MHRVSGPYRGYFIEVYSREVRGGHIGYGRISIARPKDDWRAPVASDIASSIYPQPTQALVAAEHKLRNEIEQLPPNWEPFRAPGSMIDTQYDSTK